MNIKKNLIVSVVVGVAAISFAVNTLAEDKPVGISQDIMSVPVTHNGMVVDIMRNQDNKNKVIDAFAKTSRPCPPFCIQPMTIAEGVETLGELEVIDYITQMEGGDKNILLIDSRTPDWVARGTIPGAVNISWAELTPAKGATTQSITDVMTGRFNVKLDADADEFAIDEALANGTASEIFDYSDAKTLVLFCNGMWCGQSPTSIKTLLRFGYPAEKIKWYRDGMQAWEILGLTTVKP